MNYSRGGAVRALNYEEKMIQHFENSLRTSTRAIASAMGTGNKTVCKGVH